MQNRSIALVSLGFTCRPGRALVTSENAALPAPLGSSWIAATTRILPHEATRRMAALEKRATRLLAGCGFQAYGLWAVPPARLPLLARELDQLAGEFRQWRDTAFVAGAEAAIESWQRCNPDSRLFADPARAARLAAARLDLSWARVDATVPLAAAAARALRASAQSACEQIVHGAGGASVCARLLAHWEPFAGISQPLADAIEGIRRAAADAASDVPRALAGLAAIACPACPEVPDDAPGALPAPGEPAAIRLPHKWVDL